jgi:hypothetical protein
MFRRSSLPLLGFWDISFKNADAEYTFRVTAGKARLAWCLNPSFVFIRTPEGVTMNNMKRMREETLRLRKFYLNEDSPNVVIAKTKKFIRNIITLRIFNKDQAQHNISTSWKDLYDEAERWLVEKNRDKKVEFLS